MLETDFHVHCFHPESIPEEFHRARVRAAFARSGRERDVDEVVGRIKANMADPDGDLLRADLERAGVRHAALIGLDWGLIGAPVETTGPEWWLDLGLRVLDRHAGFYSYVFGIDPRRPDAEKLARRALRSPGVRGLKLYPPAGFDPDDEICEPLYRVAADEGAFVMAHTGRQSYPFDLSRGRVEPYARVQRAHPELRLVLAHAGFPLWGRHAIELAVGHDNTFLDVSMWDRALDTEEERVRDFLTRAWRELGPGRVLWGSDRFSGPEHSEEPSPISRWKRWFEDLAGELDVDLSRSEAATLRLLGRE